MLIDIIEGFLSTGTLKKTTPILSWRFFLIPKAGRSEKAEGGVARTTGCCTETTERALVSNEA